MVLTINIKNIFIIFFMVKYCKSQNINSGLYSYYLLSLNFFYLMTFLKNKNSHIQGGAFEVLQSIFKKRMNRKN